VFPGVTTLFEIAMEGGMEQPLRPIGLVGELFARWVEDSLQPAPRRVVGQALPRSYAVDMWLMNVADHQFKRLSDGEYKGNYFWPMSGPTGRSISSPT